MTITKSDTAPLKSDLPLAFDKDALGSQSFFSMAHGGDYETAFGQTFQFHTDVLLDKITFKVRTTDSMGQF